ncbi:hypothetical protein FOE78_08020 [Microlunatus elymi]|uniref:Uncharacterized protein n=1 Tax=Microlunatus elymi TaxID=2596828 RepID=A0A516PXH5_9ACTN|nr:DUF6069 family protein [Microlunatus elymi]QDP95852.1 hypothetical protein FOE78_08020 [Microlunatus elymi]
MTQRTAAREDTAPEVTTAQGNTAGAARRRLLRAGTIAVALIAALLDWVICTKIIGLTLMVDQGFGPTEVMPLLVAAAPILSGLAAWALLAILERLTPARATTIWRIVALVILALSLYSPITAAISISTATALVSMHLVVGAILIIGLRRR